MYVNAVIFFHFRLFSQILYETTVQSVGQIGNQSLRPNVNSPDQLAPGGASCGADNQLAQLACQLALPKLNRSNVRQRNDYV